MKALHFVPGHPPVVVDVDVRHLATLQGLVGGHFDAIYLDAATALLCDDEGHLKGLAPNLYAVGPLYRGAVIVGPALVVGLDRAREDFCGLSPESLAIYWKLPRLERLP